MEKAEAEKRESKKTGGAKGADGETKKEDTDPSGATLVNTASPLQDAMKFLTPLLEFAGGNIDAQTWGFEVYLRRSKSEISFTSFRSPLLTDHSQRNISLL